jgi:mannose-6-phosphate isomerase-like protein (cupin superfamily)
MAYTKHYAGHIEKQTLKNDYFRQVIFTGKHAQLVLMSLKPKEEIGNEVHKKVDQFFRIEQGEATFVLNNGKDEHIIGNGDAIIVPAGTWHNVINNSKTKKLKLYTVYSPPNHPDKTVHKTKADAERAEKAGH